MKSYTIKINNLNYIVNTTDDGFVIKVPNILLWAKNCRVHRLIKYCEDKGYPIKEVLLQ